jgi:hypothetical protein
VRYACRTAGRRGRSQCLNAAAQVGRQYLKDLAAQLRRNWNVDFDDAGAIGRRYRRQDEIGTPYCVTVDFDTLAGSGGAAPPSASCSGTGRTR